MSLEKIKEAQKSRLNYMNDYGVLGRYDFFTTIISLESLESAHLEALLPHISELDTFHLGDGLAGITFELYQKLTKMNPLAFHEYTHYIDCTSTLWGMKGLSLMDDAYSALKNTEPGDEKSFFKAKLFFDFVRHIRLPEYYTEIGKAKSTPKNWRYQESIGQKFDCKGKITDEPIVFIKFLNENGELLARSPISTLSILECSSTAQEIEQNMRLLEALDDESAQTVELSRYTQQLISETYDQNLTEYSVCAHLLGSKIGEADIRIVYNCAGILCRLVLNFPDQIFDKIMLEKTIDDQIFNNHQESINRVYKGIENKDLGTLYLLFCNTISSKNINLQCDPKKWANKILEYLGTDLVEVQETATRQIGTPEFNIPTIEMIYEAGVSNFKKINWFKEYIDINKLALPPAYLGDGTFVNFFITEHSNGIDEVSLDELFDEMNKYEKKLLKFVEACG